MKINRSKLSMAAAISLFSTSLPALEAKTILDCKAKESTIEEYSSCLDQVQEATELELQTWINNQTFTLEALAKKTGRTESLEIFLRSQNKFIDYRETNCKWQFLASSPSPEAASVYKSCFILISKHRIKELSIQKPEENNMYRGY